MSEAAFEIETRHGLNTLTRCAHAGGTVRVPEMISGRPIEAIGMGAFLNDAALERIELPNGVTRIDDSAFQGCISLKSLELPGSLEQLGSFVFADCESLESVDLPDGLKIISYGCFATCTALSRVRFPKGLRVIANRAFAECRALTCAQLPEGLTEIGNEAFCNCLSLEAPRLPGSIRSIGHSAFFRSALAGSAYDTVRLPKGLVLLGARAFRARRLIFEGRTEPDAIGRETRVIRAPMIDPAVFEVLGMTAAACAGYAEAREEGAAFPEKIEAAYHDLIRENARELYRAAIENAPLLRELLRLRCVPAEDIRELIGRCEGNTEALAELVAYSDTLRSQELSELTLDGVL